jgi:hypothetical protein
LSALDDALQSDWKQDLISSLDYEAAVFAIEEIADACDDDMDYPKPVISDPPVDGKIGRAPWKNAFLKNFSTHNGDEAKASESVFPGISPVPSNESDSRAIAAPENPAPLLSKEVEVSVCATAVPEKKPLAGPTESDNAERTAQAEVCSIPHTLMASLQNVVIFTSCASTMRKGTAWIRLKKLIAKHTPLARSETCRVVNLINPYTLTELDYMTMKDEEGFKWFWQKEYKMGDIEQEIYYFKDRYTHATIVPVFKDVANDIVSDPTFMARSLLDKGNLRATVVLAAKKLMSTHKDFKYLAHFPAEQLNTHNHILNQLMLRGLRELISDCMAGAEPKSVPFRHGERSRTTSPLAPLSKSVASIKPTLQGATDTTVASMST